MSLFIRFYDGIDISYETYGKKLKDVQWSTKPMLSYRLRYTYLETLSCGCQGLWASFCTSCYWPSTWFVDVATAMTSLQVSQEMVISEATQAKISVALRVLGSNQKYLLLRVSWY
jgi:hypothetical protein